MKVRISVSNIWKNIATDGGKRIRTSTAMVLVVQGTNFLQSIVAWAPKSWITSRSNGIDYTQQ